MIHSELIFDPLGGFKTRVEHRSGIVDQNIQLISQAPNLVGGIPDTLLRGEVEHDGFNLNTRIFSLYSRCYGVELLLCS